jgi:hypothetical protein
MLLNQIRGKAVVFTGHSLGGAVAALTALHYLCISSSSSPPAPPVLCVTFGSPLLGNEALSRAILREHWGGNFCHVVSQHDVVPRLLFCSPDAVPAHIIVGMQLQQWPAWTRHTGAVSTVTAHMADTDKDVLRQLIQTHVGAVAVEQKLAASETTGGSPYRPFGTYVLCSPEGAACVDNPTAAVQMLYATFASQSSAGAESPEAAHSCYGELVLKMPHHLLLKRWLRVDDDMPATPNYDDGVSLALEASGIDVMVRVCVYKIYKARSITTSLLLYILSDLALSSAAGHGGVDGAALAENIKAGRAAAEPELRSPGDAAGPGHAVPCTDRMVQGAVRRRDGVLRRVQAAAVAQEVHQGELKPHQAGPVLGPSAEHARRRPAPPRFPPPRQVGQRLPLLPAPRRAS